MDTSIRAYHRTTLFDIMEARGQSISWLARKVGLSPSYLSKMKHGHRRIPKWFAEAASLAMGLPEGSLFFEPLLSDDAIITSPDIEKAA